MISPNRKKTMDIKSTKSIDKRYISCFGDLDKSLEHLSGQDRRRERNRLLAKETRKRNKETIHDLQEELRCLQKENAALHENYCKTQWLPLPVELLLAQDVTIPASISPLIEQMCTSASAGTEQPDQSINVSQEDKSYCILSSRSKHFPIVHVSEAFLALSGFSRIEVIGQHGLFLHRHEVADQKVFFQMEQALLNGTDGIFTVLSYRKSGESFWDQIQMVHVKDINGISFFVVVTHTVDSSVGFYRKHSSTRPEVSPAIMIPKMVSSSQSHSFDDKNSNLCDSHIKILDESLPSMNNPKPESFKRSIGSIAIDYNKRKITRFNSFGPRVVNSTYVSDWDTAQNDQNDYGSVSTMSLSKSDKQNQIVDGAQFARIFD